LTEKLSSHRVLGRPLAKITELDHIGLHVDDVPRQIIWDHYPGFLRDTFLPVAHSV